MSTRSSVKHYALRQLMSFARTVQSKLTNTAEAIDTMVGATLNATTSNQEKEALSIDLYDNAFNPDSDFDGLYDWEQRWFTRRLPEPPARLLVGAAGCGREAKVLERRGYAVCALEPSPRAFAYCRQTLGPTSTVVRGTYAELVGAVLSGEDLGMGLSDDDSFDAVILGWGSYGHVLSANDRYQLLRACNELVPTGPILLSIFQPAVRPTPKWARVFTKTDPPLAFVGWGGFLVEPPVKELAEHSRKLGRTLIGALDAPSPHFTLVPAALPTDVSAEERSRLFEREESAPHRQDAR